MNKTFFTIIAIIFACFSAFANDFEGQVTQTVYDGSLDNSAELKWLIKGDNIKLVMSDAQGEATFLLQEDKLIVLSDRQVNAEGQAYYFEIPSSSIKATEEIADNFMILNKEENGSTTKVEVGGSLNGELEINTTIAASIKMLSSFFKNSNEFKIMLSQNLNGFPVSSSLKNKSGVLVSHLETISIEEKSISDSEFVIPSGLVKANTQAK